MNQKRKLAAILFTDIVNYTQQSSQDELQTLRSRDTVERMVRDSAASHNGTVIKSIGDAVMIEFASAVDAVSCAINIQERTAALPSESPEIEPLQVRVGVHIGDVVEEDGDLFGNAVNIAQRIQGMAQPGGICISRDVYTQIRPILKLRCDVVTTPPKKPLPEPIEVLTVTSDALSLAGSTSKSAEHVPGWLIGACAIAFPAAWCVVMPLWTAGNWGWLFSGAALGLIMWFLLRYVATYLPALRLDKSTVTSGKRLIAGAFVTTLATFALGGGCASGGYMHALEESSFRGWSVGDGPWDHAAQFKGQEYRLLNLLDEFNGNPPQARLDPGTGGQWQITDQEPGLAAAMNFIGALVWLMIGMVSIFSAGKPSAVWTKDLASGRQISNAAMASAFGLLAALGVLWLIGDMILPTNGKPIGGQTLRFTTGADMKSSESALRQWCTLYKYAVPAYQAYVINTVPQDKQIASVSWFRVCKADIGERWRRTLFSWQPKAPFISVQLVSAAGPSKTAVLITGSMPPDDPATKAVFERDINSLENALRKASK